MAAGQRAEQVLGELSRSLVLGALLDDVRRRWGGYELVDHWQQGEFHHDVVLRVPAAQADLGGQLLIVATNCNGGVKEVLGFAELPARLALWHWRCPENSEFSGTLPPLLGSAAADLHRGYGRTGIPAAARCAFA